MEQHPDGVAKILEHYGSREVSGLGARGTLNRTIAGGERIRRPFAPYGEEVLMRAITRSLLAVAVGVGLFTPSPAAALPSDERHRPKVGSLAPEIVMARAVPDARSQATPARDSVADGIAIGAAIGAGTGLALMGWAYAQCDAGCDAPEPLPMSLQAGAYSAGVGAVVGWIIDASRKGTNRRVAVDGFALPKRAAVRVRVAF
jgi:hypothetical protein